MEIIGTILAVIGYLMYLFVMTAILFVIGFVTMTIGAAMGIVKGISYTLEAYFGTLIQEMGDR